MKLELELGLEVVVDCVCATVILVCTRNVGEQLGREIGTKREAEE